MAQTVKTRRAAMLALAGLSGCTLVDQRTFNPNAGLPPARPTAPPAPLPLAPAEPGAPPLLSVRLPGPPDLRATIARAVAAARQRKREVVFDVVEFTPGPAVGSEATDIAQMIVSQGVPASRVNLSARPVPNVAREVRVFVH
jgi:hypothetical protein